MIVLLIYIRTPHEIGFAVMWRSCTKRGTLAGKAQFVGKNEAPRDDVRWLCCVRYVSISIIIALTVDQRPLCTDGALCTQHRWGKG